MEIFAVLVLLLALVLFGAAVLNTDSPVHKMFCTRCKRLARSAQ